MAQREQSRQIDGAAMLERARKHAVQIMPLHTQKQAKAYLWAMESFQRAFWEQIQESKKTWRK